MRNIVRLAWTIWPIGLFWTPELARATEDPIRRTYTFQIENDSFSTKGTDRYYTSGLRFGVQWPDCKLPKALRQSDGLWLPFVGDPGAPDAGGCSHQNSVLSPELATGHRFNVGWVLGQNLYTPANLRNPNLQRLDRPYAAWLYLGLVFHRIEERRIDTLEVDVGTVGPNAQGAWVQTHWHQLPFIEGVEPRGWDHQIGNEAGLLILYERRWRTLDIQSHGSRIFDLIPQAGGALGNVLIEAKAGLTARLGWNLGSGFSPPSTLPAFRASDPSSSPWRQVEIYLFGGAEGRGVVHNIFLDGNTFRQSASVSKENFVADLSWGATARWRGLGLSWRQVRRSPEFVFQQDEQTFESIAVSWGLRY